MDRTADRIVRLIDRNVDDFYTDRKPYEAFSTRNGILWDRAIALGVRDAVQAIFSARFWARRES